MNEPSLEYLRQAAAVAAAAELVDVVNEAGEVVGVATRAEIRARRLPHRCTYLLVFNLSGQIFIHRRTATKDVFPSFWD
ncbi:MAG TPA: NUDIX hydrolase, partial [Planctomycetia bacterium]|nr:NUDIX hydrolase [Planctomycetia bacterium]